MPVKGKPLNESMDQTQSIPSNFDSAAPNILLTDTNRWPAPARLAIGLASVGCNVSAICPTPGHPLLKTHAVRQTFSYSGLRPLDSLQSAIETAEPQIIIPCDDRSVRHLHELYLRARIQGEAGSKLAALIERSLGSPKSYPVVSSRYDLLDIAREEGIAVPATTLINNVSDLDRWHEAQLLPWVLKADGTWGGSGVRIAQSREQARQFFLELTELPGAIEIVKRLMMNRDRLRLWNWWNRSRPAVIAQAHINGRPANCAVVCWEGKVLAGIGVEVVSAQGVKGPATVVRVVDSPEMMVSAERLAARLELSGFFGLDFMIEEGSNTTYLVEMNPRCTPLCHLQLGVGRDMVGALRTQLGDEGFPVPPSRVTENDLIAYFPQAWNCESQFLQNSFQDMPQDAPDLVDELLHPWSQRGVLGRTVDYLRTRRGQNAACEYIFSAAVPSLKTSDVDRNGEDASIDAGGTCADVRKDAR
jgi:hypothetical protein